MVTHLNASCDEKSVPADGRELGQNEPVTPSTRSRFGLRSNLFRPDDAGRADRVTHIELFFDLIFVFALTQLSRHLYENQSLLGAVQSTVLVLALWWIWIYTTWVTNWLDPAKLPVRAAVIVLALLGFVLGVSILEAYGDRGLAFAIAYVVLQLGRTIFMTVAVARHDERLRHDFVIVLGWLTLSGAIWIIGALLPLEFRLPVWAAALLLEFLSSSRAFRFPDSPDSAGSQGSARGHSLSGAHLAERSALFVIISLGESFLVTGFAFVAQESTVAGIVGVLSAFFTAVGMWWLYFDHGEKAGSRSLKSAADPDRIGRVAYTYVHAIIIGGIVLTSVADKEVLSHPDSAMKLSTALTIVGGPLLYLLGLALFRRVVSGEVVWSQLGGAVLLVVALGASALLTPLLLGVVCTLIVMATAAWETVVRVRAGTAVEESG